MSIIVAGAIVALAIVFTSGGSLGGGLIGSDKQVAPLGGKKSGDLDAEENIIVKEVTASDHIRGDINVPIKIVEFSDTECPFCKNFHQTMKTVVDEYDGQVAWIYRHFPLDALHKKARKEAEASECVAKLGGNDAFWEYIDLIFDTTTSNDGLDLSLLPQFAEQVGLNKTAFQSCLDSGETAQIVREHEQDAQLAGGNGTPHNVLILPDGRTFPVRGALPIENIRSIIDAALAGEI